MFELLDEPMTGVRRLSLKWLGDSRGSFTKIFHMPAVEEICGGMEIREMFVSESARGVVRGMHFQTPPHDHTKLVTCSRGTVLDVVLDIRVGSPTYGNAVGIELDGTRPDLLVIPPGFAHGFAALTDGAQMIYMTTAEYAPANDKGILWNSFDFDWPDTVGGSEGALSDRDRAHPTLAEFENPFRYEMDDGSA